MVILSQQNRRQQQQIVYSTSLHTAGCHAHSKARERENQNITLWQRSVTDQASEILPELATCTRSDRKMEPIKGL